MAIAETVLVQRVGFALALGALVGVEREQVPDRKYAGLRTLALLCASGPLAVGMAEAAGSVAPVAVYLLLVAAVALSIVYVRFEVQTADLGFTTSVTVFLLGGVGVLVGYGQYFVGGATTLVTLVLLAEKGSLLAHLDRFDQDDVSAAGVVGLLALVVYPLLPEGAVDPFGVLFLRQALLFVLAVLLVQFAAYLSLQWFRSRLGVVAAAGVGGVVSSLAVVSSLTEYAGDDGGEGAAASAALSAAVAMVLRNAALAVALSDGLVLLEPIALPFLLAAGIGAVAARASYRRGQPIDGDQFGTDSPFSFRRAFLFGLAFLTVLVVSEAASTWLSVAGAYGTAFVGGLASSTAVVASSVALLAAGALGPTEAALAVALGTAASLCSKLAFVGLGGARVLARRLAVPYLLMGISVLAVAR